MKIVIAVLALMPVFAHAASYDDFYRPLPVPPCGDYVDDCIPQNPKPGPLPLPGPCPKPWDDCREIYEISPLGDLRTKTSALSAAIADGKMDTAAASLNGLFTGAGSKAKGSERSAVAAGGWSSAPRTDAGLSRFRFAPRGSQMRPLIERMDGKHEAKISTVADANPKSNDGEVIGALAGAVAGSVAGPVGTVAGGIAGAIGGALHDFERKADKDEATYEKGNEDRRRDQQED